MKNILWLYMLQSDSPVRMSHLQLSVPQLEKASTENLAICCIILANELNPIIISFYFKQFSSLSVIGKLTMKVPQRKNNYVEQPLLHLALFISSHKGFSFYETKKFDRRKSSKKIGL